MKKLLIALFALTLGFTACSASTMELGNLSVGNDTVVVYIKNPQTKNDIISGQFMVALKDASGKTLDEIEAKHYNPPTDGQINDANLFWSKNKDDNHFKMEHDPANSSLIHIEVDAPMPETNFQLDVKVENGKLITSTSASDLERP